MGRGKNVGKMRAEIAGKLRGKNAGGKNAGTMREQCGHNSAPPYTSLPARPRRIPGGEDTRRRSE